MNDHTHVPTIIRNFPDPLCPMGHHVHLSGVRYRVVKVRPLADGQVEHHLRAAPEPPARP